MIQMKIRLLNALRRGVVFYPCSGNDFDDKTITYGSEKSFDDSLSVKKAQAEIIKVFSIPGQKEQVSFSNKEYVKLFSEAYIEDKKTKEKGNKK